MECASYTRTLSIIGMPRTSDSASSRLSAFKMQYPTSGEGDWTVSSVRPSLVTSTPRPNGLPGSTRRGPADLNHSPHARWTSSVGGTNPYVSTRNFFTSHSCLGWRLIAIGERAGLEVALVVLEGRLLAAPVGMKLARPVLKQPQPSGMKDQGGGAAGLAAADQACVLQDLDMLVDRRKRQASHPGELADGAGLQAENVNDLTPVRVRQGLQDAVEHGRGAVFVCHIS